ncbi:MAG: isochorismatase family protein [Hornefia sp.]|nr:isochorismatase family protein [Hornefia sp.]
MKNILILVDMQNGFTRYSQTEDLSKKIESMLSLNLFDMVVATQFMNYDRSIYEQLMGWRRLKTDEDRAIRAELMPYINEIIPKSVYTCVSSNFIQRICQLNDGAYPEKLFIAGADTDCCVLKIAVDLFENNIRPIVLTNYCDSNGGEEFHKSGILCMKRLIGEKQLLDITLTDNTDISVL